MAKVSLNHLHKTYPVSGGKEVAAIGDLSLEIQNREFVVMTGPPGSGKTTLLRLIAGLEQATSGEIAMDDRALANLKPHEREVAMVFPDDALYPEMSVRQNIELGLKRRKFSQTEISRRVEDAATAMGIAELLARPPRELSTEQRRRAAIARAIARQPRVLLLDEPLAALDPAARTQLRAEIRKLHERLQTTVIYATRDASEALAMGERLIVFRAGRMEQDDAPRTAYAAPANVFVGGFLGTMNFVGGTLKRDRDGWLFTEAEEGTIQVRFPFKETRGDAETPGGAVLLGIRPENVEIGEVAKGTETAETFPALLDFVETTGAETILHLETGAHGIVSRRASTARDQPAGRRVRFRFDLEAAHFFDPVSGLRLRSL